MVIPGASILLIFHPTKLLIFLIITTSFSHQLNLNKISSNVWSLPLERSNIQSWYEEGMPGMRNQELAIQVNQTS